METIILGLLLMEPMTSYDLRNHIKQKFAMMCSDSPGSIQVALKKLLSGGHIKFNEYVENGKNKKKYEITDAGHSMFNAWLAQPMNHRKAKNMELSKLFFMGHVEANQRRSLLNAYRESLCADWKELDKLREDILTSMGGIPISSLSDEVQYQLATLDYGIALFSFEMDWYEKLLEQIEKGKHA